MNIPALSQRYFANRMLMAELPVAGSFLTNFLVEDRTANIADPSNCKWINRFIGGAVGWSAKLAIDADGPAAGAGYTDGEALDPDSGQDGTSLRFTDGSSMSSEGTPYYVLPGDPFGITVGLKLGDVGVIIYKDKVTAAILGDTGPHRKIGEASIRVHNRLRPAAPDPCSHRDDQGRCLRIRNASIDSDVIAIFFQRSALSLANEETAQQEIEDHAFSLWLAIGGLLPDMQLRPASPAV